MEGVTKKNPKKVKAGKKAYQTRMLKMKEDILAGTRPASTGSMPPSTGSTPASTLASNPSSNPTTIKSTDGYMYGVGSLAILAVGLCIFFLL